MSRIRQLSLTLGPLVLIGLCYWVAQPRTQAGRVAAARLAPRIEPVEFNTNPEQVSLEAACRTRAAEIAKKLGAGSSVVVHVPFVLAGDLSEPQLDRQYRDTILPTSRALSISYFDYVPDEPVTLLLFSNEDSYQEYAERLDGRRRANYHGYYLRQHRRVILNIGTGSGTLAHELTHALAHFDFPEMPEWFDEGLASLHEQSEFSDDGNQLLGVSNWRLHYLLPAVRQNRLQSLATLMTADTVRSDNQAVDYAQARFFCLFLQQRGLLPAFYRKFRTAAAADPTGAQTLLRLFDSTSLIEIDEEFRTWLGTLHPPALDGSGTR